MLKKLLFPFILASTTLFSEFVQFTDEDYNLYRTSQDWMAAQQITLNVKKGYSVYLLNYTRSWYENLPDLGASDYLAGFDMTANHYGYVYAELDSNGNLIPTGDIHYANGNTKEVTVKNPNGPQTQTLTGYYLDTFDRDGEIFLVMTPNGFDGTVNSYDLVNAPGYESYLESRQINTYDLTGQTRVNFGTIDDIGHEFVIGYEASPAPSGQPLPGVLVSSIVGMCTVGVISKRRHRHKE